MEIHTLSELQYSEDRDGPWKLYVYEPNSQYYRGGKWFSKEARYPDDELTIMEAEVLFLNAMAEQREIRICDGGDHLVVHAKAGRILHGATFWQEIKKVDHSSHEYQLFVDDLPRETYVFLSQREVDVINESFRGSPDVFKREYRRRSK